jgi:hypothetical protein
MNTEKLNHWLSLTANIGVLIGIIFLAIEIGQTNQLMEAEARYNQLTGVQETYTLLIENPDFAETFAKAVPSAPPTQGDYSSFNLTYRELFQMTSYMRMIFNRWQWEFNESVEPDLPVEYWKRVLSNDFHQTWWDRNKFEFEQEFVSFLDSIR